MSAPHTPSMRRGERCARSPEEAPVGPSPSATTECTAHLVPFFFFSFGFEIISDFIGIHRSKECSGLIKILITLAAFAV